MNKTSKHISPKINEHKKNPPRYMAFEIQVLAWDRHKYVAGLNRLMSSLPPCFDTSNWNHACFSVNIVLQDIN
jgi:hypothetical protein